MENAGRRVFGLAAAGFGLSYLVWRDFATVWQPVPADAPLHSGLVYVAAVAMLVGGAAMFLKRPSALAGFVLALVYGAFALLQAQQVIGSPGTEATWGGLAEEVALVIGALLVCDAASPNAVRAIALRLLFGLCAIVFGLTHFANLAATAGFVPGWFPGDGMFWAYATGFAHAAAGLALIVGYRPRLAARGLTAMFIGFGLFVWLPKLVAAPTDHVAWTGNIVNLALIGAAWLLADALSDARPAAEN